MAKTELRLAKMELNTEAIIVNKKMARKKVGAVGKS